MRRARSWVTLAWASTLLVAASGCSDTPSVETTTAEGTVSGTVRVRGQPMAGGEISFDPSNVERKDEKPRKATIGPDGKYSVTTLQGQNSADIRADAQERASTGLRHSHDRCQGGRQPLRHRPAAEVNAGEGPIGHRPASLHTIGLCTWIRESSFPPFARGEIFSRHGGLCRDECPATAEQGVFALSLLNTSRRTRFRCPNWSRAPTRLVGLRMT